MLESGYTHIDTADVYGDSEELIGKWSVHHPVISCNRISPPQCSRLQKSGKRNEIFLATKFGMALGGPLPDGRHVCGDPEYVATAIDRSLKLLQTDHVDLWYLHR